MIREFGWSEVWFLVLAARWTIGLTATAFIVGGLLGIAIALVRTSRFRVLSVAAAGYVRLFQNTPLLIQLFLIYYGVALFGLRPSAWVAGTLGLTLHASAYLGEIWRGSILSVPRKQWEAAESLALSPLQMRLYVILPQAIRISIAPTVGFLVQLLKNSSLVSIVGIEELMRAASMMNTATWKPFLVLSTAALIYFCICFPLTMLSRQLEKKTHGYN